MELLIQMILVNTSRPGSLVSGIYCSVYMAMLMIVEPSHSRFRSTALVLPRPELLTDQFPYCSIRFLQVDLGSYFEHR